MFVTEAVAYVAATASRFTRSGGVRVAETGARLSDICAMRQFSQYAIHLWWRRQRLESFRILGMADALTGAVIPGKMRWVPAASHRRGRLPERVLEGRTQAVQAVAASSQWARWCSCGRLGRTWWWS